MRQLVMPALASDANLAKYQVFALRPADHDLSRDVPLIAKHRLDRNVQIWKGIDQARPNGLAQFTNLASALAVHRHIAQLGFVGARSHHFVHVS